MICEGFLGNIDNIFFPCFSVSLIISVMTEGCISDVLTYSRAPMNISPPPPEKRKKKSSSGSHGIVQTQSENIHSCTTTYSLSREFHEEDFIVRRE